MQKKSHKFEGQTFERLFVVKRIENAVMPSGAVFSKWLCRCSCGNQTSVLGVDLKSGKTRSCGCLFIESARIKGLTNRTHGMYSISTSVDDVIRFRTLLRIRDRANRRGYESDLQIEDIPILTDTCPVLGIKYKKGKGKLQDASPSIDRLNSNLPYLKKYKDNLCYISHKANRIKNNATVEDLRKVLEFIERAAPKGARTDSNGLESCECLRGGSESTVRD